MRLNRGTFIFVVVLAVIILAAVFLLRDDSDETPDTTETTAAPQAVFEDLTTDAVTALNITRRVEEDEATVTPETELVPTAISLVYTNETWVLENADESAEDREIDQTRVEQAVSTLLGLRYRDSFESDNLAQFGLDAPAYDVTFSAGDATYQLQVGNKNISGTQYYALIGDDGLVYLLTSATNADTVLNLVTNLPYVIPPTPTPVPVLNAPGPIFTGLSAEAITSFTLTDTEAGTSLVLVRNDETFLWEIAGSDAAVEQQLVGFVLGQFAVLQAIDEVPGDNLAALGLETPTRSIIASVGEDENYIIALGNTDATGTRYYARINAFTDIAVMEVSLLDFIFGMLENPPIVPEATPEVTADAEATEAAEATADAEATEAMTEEATEEADTSDEATEEAETSDAEATDEAEATEAMTEEATEEAETSEEEATEEADTSEEATEAVEMSEDMTEEATEETDACDVSAEMTPEAEATEDMTEDSDACDEAVEVTPEATAEAGD